MKLITQYTRQSWKSDFHSTLFKTFAFFCQKNYDFTKTKNSKIERKFVRSQTRYKTEKIL